MKLTIKDIKGTNQGELEIKFPVVEDGSGTQAVHQAVVAQRAAGRSGTACTKTMGDVAGSGKKPWRQKGTGRARAGSFASPLWRGGGVVFGPKPRSFRQKISKTTRQTALRKALSERIKSGDVTILKDWTMPTPKTKEFTKVLAALDVQGTVLFVVPALERNLALAARNLPGVEFITASTLNTYEMLRFDKILITEGAFAQVEERLAKA
jgi:large subunit ribosomal protein L4